ncbi:PREDICTED: uncharacterized protein C14orf105 homolog [Apaloderma vittatum]|uniref:uncharacterized protein C14orf105 homolog n=1 Tax=Apaloderma vittatum TaxID=57397 RepID=UPI000521C696|nr:PREDICTED: uncharacterized protein C14orf105 homolog [Apaloderma vittatum]
MGLSSSKAHPKVTKVAPMRAGEDLPALATRYQLPAVAEWGNPNFHQQLPPLRETWYRRASAGPLSFNTVPEKRKTSIIKQHPPRRPQRLEPAGPPQTIAPAKPWSHQDVDASPKTKGLEKRGQSLIPLPGRRQHLHKLQMLDLTRRRREAELKRNLHRETKIHKQKIKEFSPKKVLDTLQRCDSAESRDRNTWGEGLSRQHDGAEFSPGRSRKVDLWFCREPRTRDLFWDTSSTSSEEWEREDKIYCKHALVRTKTERVSLFDDFFDRDF